MSYKEPKIEEAKEESIDSLATANKWEIDLPELETSDYSYWASQEPLNAEYQVRWISNISIKSWSITFTWSTWNKSVTGIWFKPKTVQLNASANGIARWISVGTADDWQTGQCVYQYWDSALDANSIIKLRNSSATPTHEAQLVSMDTDGFTVDFTTFTTYCECTYTCFW